MTSQSVLTFAVATLAIGLSSQARATPADDTTNGRPLARHALRLAQSQLPRCVLYSSMRLTAEGLMRCSYQCGDRIVIQSSYNSCPSSVARPSQQ